MFGQIAEAVEYALETVPECAPETVEDVYALDRAARETADAFLSR